MLDAILEQDVTLRVGYDVCVCSTPSNFLFLPYLLAETQNEENEVAGTQTTHALVKTGRIRMMCVGNKETIETKQKKNVSSFYI